MHFAFDAPPTIPLEDQYTVWKNSVNDVYRSSGENYDLHSHTDSASKIGLQVAKTATVTEQPSERLTADGCKTWRRYFRLPASRVKSRTQRPEWRS